MISKTKLNIIVYLTRAVLLILLGAFVAFNGRGWFAEWFGIKIPQEYYQWIGYAWIWIIVILAVPKLRKAILEDRKKLKMSHVDLTKLNIAKGNISKYRYRYTTVCIALAVDIILLSLPYMIIDAIINNPHKLTSGFSISELTGIIIIFGIPAIVTAYFLYLLLYSVHVDGVGISIIIKGFNIKKFSWDQISSVAPVRMRGGKYMTVKLSNGEKYNFDSWLKNSSELFHILQTHVATSSGGK